MADFKEIQLHSFGKDPIVATNHLRKLEKDEVLVKILRATAHPSDLMFIKGMYGVVPPKEFPIVPGFEGSGIVQDVGEDVSKDLIGKYCSVGVFLTSSGKAFKGVWTQYHYTKPQALVVYNDKVDLNSACFAFANPLTAFGFLDIAKKHNAKAVVQNGAFSALGKIFIRLCLKEGLPLINIIRKQEQVKQLQEIGAKYIINSSEEGWQKKLKILLKELDATIAFDCVGGASTFPLFQMMPPNSTLIHFGNLELKKLNGFDSSDFIFLNKSIKGFWLNTWLSSLSKSDREAVYLKLKKEVEDNSDLIKTFVSQEVSLDDFVNGLKEYANNMSKGKIVLKPNF